MLQISLFTMTRNYFITLFFYLFIGVCNIYHLSKEKWIELYDYNPAFKQCITLIQKTIRRTYFFLKNKKLEPEEETWVCNCGILRNPSTNQFDLQYVENYVFTKECPNKHLSTLIRESPERLAEMIQPIVIFKNKSCEKTIRYIVRMDGNYAPVVYIKSSAKFFAIEYSHPSMNYTIELKLAPEWFMQGNELFSPTFILRLLEYQDQSFIFDESYTLRVIDSNCEIFEINSKNYLVLTQTAYEIKPFDFFGEPLVETETDSVASNDEEVLVEPEIEDDLDTQFVIEGDIDETI